MTKFLRQGIHVFAPLPYVNHIAESLGLTSPEERREVVMPYLFQFLKAPKGLILITEEGWDASWGVQQALTFAEENQIPIHKFSPEDMNNNQEPLRPIAPSRPHQNPLN